ncbi:cation:proton antiporter [Desulfobacter latus]|uniref:Cation:proton antiporter n=2 Tax=Desulfobacter latus TaxID=2292 RepID=A0A850TFL3_9BACT|nr:MnhB domain-containing protein [Desulfobacter latus]NWH06246.1 cation:proton antiporter [Desulfobacter latus]
MTVIYLIIIAAVFVKLSVFVHGVPEVCVDIVGTIVSETGVPNAVAGILLRNRVYDTVFEVMVFSIAVQGVHVFLSRHAPVKFVTYVREETSVILARLGASVSAMLCVELALRGHLSPGGGFAAGVAGGTAIGLVAITSPPEEMQRHYERWRAKTAEKSVLLLFLVLTGIFLHRPDWFRGDMAALFSALAIPFFNLLIALKVTIGTWTVTHLFIRYRGLL